MFTMITVISIFKFLQIKYVLRLKATWGSIYSKSYQKILIPNKSLLFPKRSRLKKALLPKLTFRGKDGKKDKQKDAQQYTTERHLVQPYCPPTLPHQMPKKSIRAAVSVKSRYFKVVFDK